MITAGLQGSVDKSLWAFKRWRHVLSLSLLRTQRHIHTHGRVDSQYNELIGWNLNNAQAKQSDSWPGKCCVSWTEAVVFLVLREDYRKPLNCFSQMKSILLNKIQAGLYIVVQKYMKYHLNSPFSSCYTSCQLQKKKKKVFIFAGKLVSLPSDSWEALILCTKRDFCFSAWRRRWGGWLH